MTKTAIPLQVNDITAFTRILSRQLAGASPSHLALMNMLARAAGYQNMQHMRAARAAAKRLEAAQPEVIVDARSVERTLTQFDPVGRLRHWPAKRAVQTLALWALWARLPPQVALNERQVTDIFAAEHVFNDPATLRRTMISCGMLTRLSDGSDYRRIEQKPPAEAQAVIHALSSRRLRRQKGQ